MTEKTTIFSKAEEYYIAHEVELRLHEHKFQLFEQSLKNLDEKLESSLDKFDTKLELGLKHLHTKLDTNLKHLDTKLDTNLKHLDNKLGWMLGIFISTGLAACLIPIAFHFIHIG